jgi:hypothetical protein
MTKKPLDPNQAIEYFRAEVVDDVVTHVIDTFALIQYGNIEAFSVDLDISQPDDARLDEHDRRDFRTHGESKNHLRLKIWVARYLEETGHTIPTRSVDGVDLYDCFDVNIDGVQFDVACSCDGEQTVADVGKTMNTKLLDAFGFTQHNPRGGSKEVVENLVRTEETPVDTYLFLPNSALFEPNKGILYVFEKRSLPNVGQTLYEAKTAERGEE